MINVPYVPIIIPIQIGEIEEIEEIEVSKSTERILLVAFGVLITIEAFLACFALILICEAIIKGDVQ